MLDSTIPNYEINISGYDIVRKEGWGSIIYQKCNWLQNKKWFNEWKSWNNHDWGCPLKAKSFFVNTWYRPPDASIECFEWYEECIINMDLENKETILMGDFNCDWSKLSNNNAASHTVRMATLASTYQFEQMIKEPTRVTAASRTLLILHYVTNQNSSRCRV
jgi:hypothetical protein